MCYLTFILLSELSGLCSLISIQDVSSRLVKVFLMIFILNTFVLTIRKKRKVGELINEKRFLALAIVLGTGLLSGCTNAGEKQPLVIKAVQSANKK